MQDGIHVLLQIFKTTSKGWGVRALHDIPKGTFLTVYSAQILSEESADDCGRDAGDEYFANLDFIDCAEATKEAYEADCALPLDFDEESSADNDDDCEDLEDGAQANASDDEDYVAPPLLQSSHATASDGRTPGRVNEERQEPPRPQVALKRVRSALAEALETRNVDDAVREPTDKRRFRSFFEGSSVYILDAMKKGNVGRFLNHSCTPNAFAQNVFFETHDLRFPTVAFFASRTIFALEEITWDYQYEVDSVPGRKMYCHCRADNCRGRLI